MVWDFQKIRTWQKKRRRRKFWGPKSAAGGPKFGNIASKLVEKRRRRPEIWRYCVKLAKKRRRRPKMDHLGFKIFSWDFPKNKTLRPTLVWDFQKIKPDFNFGLRFSKNKTRFQLWSEISLRGGFKDNPVVIALKIYS